MSLPTERLPRRLWRLLSRLVASPYFWGAIGWALLILRYGPEVIHPRYGG